MKQVWPWLLVVCCLSLPIVAQDGTSGPVAKFAKQEHDFGVIDQGVEVTARFKFENAGDKALEIKGISTSCGCTSAKPEKTVYQPGEQGEIPVTFNSSRFTDVVTKSVRVITNDPKMGTTLLTIRANVAAQIISKPAQVFITDARYGKKTKSEIMVSAPRLPRLEVSDLKTTPEFLSATTQRIDEKTVKILLEIDGNKFPEGESRPRASLTYKTNATSGQKEMRSAVTVHVKLPIIVSPRFLLFWATKVGKQRSMVVDLKMEDEAFTINNPEVDLDFLKVDITRDEANQKRLTLTVTDKAPPGAFKGELTLNTSVAAQKKVVIPIRGSVIK